MAGCSRLAEEVCIEKEDQEDVSLRLVTEAFVSARSVEPCGRRQNNKVSSGLVQCFSVGAALFL